MIDMFDAGREAHAWWPDWRGKVVVLLATGPSAKCYDYYQELKGKDVRVAAIRGSVDLYEGTDAVYASDEDWWAHSKGLSWFKGLRIGDSLNACYRYKGLLHVRVRHGTNSMLFNEAGVLGSGGGSGFRLLNLVCQFGARAIVLCGFDMNPDVVAHWYGRNKWSGAGNPARKKMDQWRAHIDAAAKPLRKRGVEVINASMFSSLCAYPKSTLGDALCHLRA